jgi:hypothetical protein
MYTITGHFWSAGAAAVAFGVYTFRNRQSYTHASNPACHAAAPAMPAHPAQAKEAPQEPRMQGVHARALVATMLPLAQCSK